MEPEKKTRWLRAFDKFARGEIARRRGNGSTDSRGGITESRKFHGSGNGGGKFFDLETVGFVYPLRFLRQLSSNFSRKARLEWVSNSEPRARGMREREREKGNFSSLSSRFRVTRCAYIVARERRGNAIEFKEKAKDTARLRRIRLPGAEKGGGGDLFFSRAVVSKRHRCVNATGCVLQSRVQDALYF